MKPRYPVKVRLIGEDGNAFAILGRVRAALKAYGVPPEELRAFNNQAIAGDYDHLLKICQQWVDVV